MSFLSTTLGDITRLKVDAVVNAANETLLGGNGVDGAIHRAAGPALQEHCRTLGGCEIGQVKITPGFQLPAKWIIHTVGPRWVNGQYGESAQLACCYRNALKLAAANSIRTLAFPCISTGAYGYPFRAAAQVAVETVRAFIDDDGSLTEIIFCCFTREDLRIYDDLLATE